MCAAYYNKEVLHIIYYLHTTHSCDLISICVGKDLSNVTHFQSDGILQGLSDSVEYI